MTIFSLLFLAFLFVSVAAAAPGDLDPGFGSGGIARTPIGKISADYGYAAALQPDGKIIIAGTSADGLRQNLFVSRLNADGTLDNTFGVGGKSVKIVGFSVSYASAVAIQPDGKIITGRVGRCPTSFTNCFTLVRFSPNGSVDNSFGTNGVVQTTFDAQQLD
ncbi:MAG TPA: delta-60 repeat domain-containing protein [Pyrinomonadaceae bacterium]